MTLRAIHDVAAPAKLNLFLHVVGRRADGYHLLQSVFVLIDWADTLHFERRGDGALLRHDLSTMLPPDDLCLRAARSLQSAGLPAGPPDRVSRRPAGSLQGLAGAAAGRRGCSPGRAPSPSPASAAAGVFTSSVGSLHNAR